MARSYDEVTAERRARLSPEARQQHASPTARTLQRIADALAADVRVIERAT